MSDYIYSMLLVVCEMLCCKIFFEIFGEKRYKKGIQVIQTVLLCCGAFGIARISNDYFLLKQIILIILLMCFSYGYIKVSIPKAIIFSIICIAVLTAIDYLTIVIINTVFNKEILLGEHSQIETTLVALLGRGIAFVLVLSINRYFKNKNLGILSKKEWIKILVFPVFSIIVIAVMLLNFGYIIQDSQIKVLYTIAFGMVGMNFYVFYLISNIIKQEGIKRENQVFKTQVQNQAKMYQTISQNYEVQKKRTHEYKNHLLCIESLLRQKQYLKLEEYVKEIYGKLGTELESINTNNVIVNAILNTKYQEAIEKGIVFVFKGNDLSDMKMSDNEVVTLLSNLLNNAIEACEQCENKRIIKCKFIKEKNRIIISVRNTCNQKIHYINGEIQSSKTDNIEEHGIGIKNIKKVVEENNGSYVIKQEGDEFCFSIVLPY